MKKFCVANNKRIFVPKIGFFLSVIFVLTILIANSYCDADIGINWPVYLRTPEHNSATSEQIQVPLKLKWKFFADKIFNPEGLGEFRFFERNAFSWPPIVLNDKVFIRDNRGILYAISLKSGELLWKRNGQNHCYLAGDEKLNLIFSSPYRRYEVIVCALNVDTGNIVWEKVLDAKWGRTPGQGGSPVSLTADSDGVIAAVSSVAKDSNNIFRLNKTTGAFVWEQIVSDSIESPPVICENKIIVMSKWTPNISPSDYSITVVSEDNGYILSTQNLGKIRDFPDLSLIVLNNDIIVKIKEAILLRLNSKTLERTNAKSFEGGYSIDAYVYEDGKLYLKKNGIVCYDVKNDFIKWSTQFETWGTALPLVTKKHIFINSGSKIVAVNKETGKIEDVHDLNKYRSRFQVGPNGFDRNYIPASFIAVDNTLLVACGDGGLYAFEGTKQN